MAQHYRKSTTMHFLQSKAASIEAFEKMKEANAAPEFPENLCYAFETPSLAELRRHHGRFHHNSYTSAQRWDSAPRTKHSIKVLVEGLQEVDGVFTTNRNVLRVQYTNAGKSMELNVPIHVQEHERADELLGAILSAASHISASELTQSR